MHIRQVVAAAPDLLPVTDEGRADFVANWSDFMAGIRQYMNAKIKQTELRFYDVPSTPGADMGDPVLIAPTNFIGTSQGDLLPPQCAISVTFKTPERKRWGRFYLPGIVVNALDANGRVEQATASTIALEATKLTSRAGTGGALTVFSRTHWNHQDPTIVQVDDIVDIIRRRRFSSPHFKSQYEASA